MSNSKRAAIFLDKLLAWFASPSDLDQVVRDIAEALDEDFPDATDADAIRAATIIKRTRVYPSFPMLAECLEAFEDAIEERMRVVRIAEIKRRSENATGGQSEADRVVISFEERKAVADKMALLVRKISGETLTEAERDALDNWGQS
jgi:hypothetical protein